MSWEPVDVYIKDQDDNPIEGVLIKIYNQAGSLYYTNGTTDADGHVGLLLETLNYSFRFYKFKVSFEQPQLFTVLEAPETNVFDVQGSVIVPPEATDPRLCRASGYFRDINGGPKRYLDMHFISRFSPILLEDAGVVTERQAIRTDEDGYACIDLIRCAEYDATIQDMEEHQRKIRVPDRASVNLPDLLLARVGYVLFEEDGPYTVAVGGELLLTPSLFATTHVPLEPITLDAYWRSSDASILNVAIVGSQVRLRGVAAGAAQLLILRRDTTIIKIPDTPIVGQPVDITVTP